MTTPPPPPDLVSPLLPPPSPSAKMSRSPTVHRKTLGIILLAIVVFLWVSSTFLTFALFSDGSYTKPYFITYLNTCSFCLYLLPGALRALRARRSGYVPVEPDAKQDVLDPRQTVVLSLQFCVLWFMANYFQNSSLDYTSPASATILSSTSGIFTLLLGAALRIERFSWGKLLAVVCSVAGIALVSGTDSAPSPTSSTSSGRERAGAGVLGRVLVGDSMALLGAFAYGVYTVLLKVRIGNEARIDMMRFFGFVGLFNLLGLWPGIVLLDYVGVEKFEMPPDGRVWCIVAINALITLVSDYCWVYAMLLTTPLIATVGLSLSIPLALLGQMVVLGVWSGAVYWVGATLVFAAFLFVNRESEVDSDVPAEQERWDR